jgi:hypothetical protein
MEFTRLTDGDDDGETGTLGDSEGVVEAPEAADDGG